MTQTAAQALKQAVIEIDERVYAFVRLPPNAIMAAAGVIAQVGEPFAALIADRHEVTVVLPWDLVDDFRDRFRDVQVGDIRYRAITLDVETGLIMVGFIARISAALAAANISIMPFASYNRDHVLVPESDLDRAVQTLRELQAIL